MKKISKILVPTDFSQNANNAFRYAIWMADKCNAEITLYHVVSTEIVTADMPMVSAELTQQKVENAKELLKTTIDTTLLQSNIGSKLKNIPLIKSCVEIGSAASQIAVKGESMDADLIIIGTREEHDNIDILFGSITTATIERAKTSVLVVPEDFEKHKISNLAYATEINDSNPFHIWETIQLLSIFDPSIKVINVKEKSSEGGLSLSDFEEYFSGNKVSARISFHELLKEDSIADVIEDYIEDNRMDLLVMHKPHRGFFQRLFHKSITKELSREIDIPLLVLK